MENIKIKCPKCSSENVKKDGLRKTENRGNIQRYKCKDCNTRFVVDDGFFRMRNAPQKITCALDLFYKGVSTRKVQEHFKAFYPHNSDHTTIMRWIFKYSEMIATFTDNLKLNVGEELQIDEVEYKRRKKHNTKGTENNWFIDSIDTETRFLVASKYVKSRGQEEIKGVLKEARKQTGDQFKVITSDGFTAYPKAVTQSFGYYNFLRKEIRHNVVNASKGQGFNYPIERFHNTLRQRTKVFRGFHGSIDTANLIMKGFCIHYNFITKHQGINCTPSELAIPSLKFSLSNRWLELITNSKKD